ncbi:hypothetical protein TH60_14250 [Pantoea ananatis]|nr:hypothetical protein [Pantoea ananatis]
MNQWWKSLQSDYIAEWMLLVTLGCLGVPDGPYKISSFLLAILFFAGKLKKLQKGGPFAKVEKVISERIKKATLSSCESTKLLQQLNKVKSFRKKRNFYFVLRRNWRFVLGYTFMMVSAIFYFFSFLGM